MTRPVRFTDGVLAAIEREIAAVPPERGAVLLGFADVVHLAVLDSHGRYSGVSWDISAELGGAVSGLEEAHGGTFAGTVHSHPSGVSDPSGTDIASTATMLRLNAHLESLVVAIVTEGEPYRDHHIPVGTRHRMSLHRVRLVDDRPEVTPVRGEVVELVAGLDDADRPVQSSVSVRDWRADAVRSMERAPRVATWRGRESLFVGLGGDRRLTLVVPPDYPLSGPALLASREGAGFELQPSPWDPALAPRRQVRNLVRTALASGLTSRLDRARPVVGELWDRVVLVAGAGSVGSRIAEDLVRAGVGHLVLLDPETVEAPNLARSVYDSDDLGDLKVDALERHLRRIDSSLGVVTTASSIGASDVAELLRDVDLVVGATDDMRDQLVLAHHAYAAGIPMVTCALYAGAEAGEIVVSLPSADTPCVACSLGDGRNINQFRPSSDYGLGGRLTAEPGLGASINVVASMAALVALGVLAGPGSSLTALVGGSVATDRTLAMISTRPHWGFFPELFGDGGHQLAPQSVWIRVERAADCVVCGAPEARRAPIDAGFGTDLAAVRADLERELGFEEPVVSGSVGRAAPGSRARRREESR